MKSPRCTAATAPFPPGREDTGSATLFACISLSAVLVLTVLLAALGGAITARHRAQTGADLAALAVAGALPDGTETACAAGQQIAQRNRVRLRACGIHGWDATVRVTAAVALGPFGDHEVSAVARAGPREDQ